MLETSGSIPPQGDESPKSPKNLTVIKKRARWIGVGILTAGFIGISLMTSTKSAPEPKTSISYTNGFSTALSEEDPKILMMEKRKQENELLKVEVEKTKAEMKELKSIMKSLESLMEETKGAGAPTPHQNTPSVASPSVVSPLSTKKIVCFENTLGPRIGGPSVSHKKYVENFLPASTYIEGVLLTGVDAPATVAGGSDPLPVLIRLTGRGNMPRGFKGDVAQCRIVGAATGNIASERAMIRLEKLVCIERETGEVIETSISGYVSGEDGHIGLRGRVVDKTGSVIGNAALSGLADGVMQFLQQGSRLFLPGSDSSKKDQILSRLLETTGTSSSNAALGRISEYYIKRAEQLQPVIEVPSGRFVNVVITQGVSLGETDVKKAIQEHRQSGRDAAVETLKLHGVR